MNKRPLAVLKSIPAKLIAKIKRAKIARQNRLNAKYRRSTYVGE